MNTVNSQAFNTHPIKSRKLMTELALAFAAIVGSNTPAEALSFEFTFSDNTPLEVRSVFWKAGDAWSKQFTDDVTVNIFVDYGTLPTNVLAGSRPGMTRVTYSEFRTQLGQDKIPQIGSDYVSKNYDDYRAWSQLQNGTTFKYLRNTYNATTNTWGVGTEDGIGDTIWLTRANAKALNLINQTSGNYNNFDASIRISNTASWHYDTKVAAPSGKQDLLTVATHEIGHAMGVVSGTDAFQLLSLGGTLTAQNLKHVTPMDLLRYSESTKSRGIPDWTKNQAYFSLDRGANNLGGFSRGATIDKYQAGHWKHGESRGVMTPFLDTGTRLAISELDQRLLDAIGWDRAAQKSKNVAAEMLRINWDSSNPDLSLLENSLKAHLSIDMENLRKERDAIQGWNYSLWQKLKDEADKVIQERQLKIQETLNKIRVEKSDPGKRMEQALIEADDYLVAMANIANFYRSELQKPEVMPAQANYWLKRPSAELKNYLSNATQLQLRALAVEVSKASASQRSILENQIKEALKLLYQETHNTQTPSAIELDTALAKLLNADSSDAGMDWIVGFRFWQTGDTKSTFEQTGEFTFHTSATEFSAAPETDVVPEPAWKTGMLGLLGLFGIGSVLKRRGKKKCVAS